MAAVELDGVTKVFPGGVRAVDGLRLTVAEGECVALVGPSGCGKTTTLRLMAGLEEPSGGTIRIGGRVVNHVPPQDRDVAMVFQNDALYPHLTVYKNMAFGLRLRGVPRAEIDNQVRMAAATLGIAALLGRKPGSLSGGQRRRVALGRALVRRPQVFLFDEPLSSLDATLRLQMRAELRRLHGTLGITTIYVTHDQEEALTVGDRVAVIRDGAVQQCAGPREVYDRPANRFVAAFVGMPPMNFIDGRVSAESGRLHFDAGAFRLALPDCFHPALSRWVGRHAVLGVRPTDLAPADGIEAARGRFAGEGNRLEARITALEPLGEKMDLHVATSDGQTIVCRTDARGGLTDGTTLTLCLDMRRVHVFEPGAEGVNIGLSSAGDQASAA